MNKKPLLAFMAGTLLLTHVASAQITLANWTFESSHPSGTPGAGVWITNVAAEIGSGTASAQHAGNAVYSSPVGNGSSRPFSSTDWTNQGAFYQFAVNTLGFQKSTSSLDEHATANRP